MADTKTKARIHTVTLAVDLSDSGWNDPKTNEPLTGDALRQALEDYLQIISDNTETGLGAVFVDSVTYDPQAV